MKLRFAYATTGDAAVNEGVRREANERGVWLNGADDPDLGDCFAPAIVRRGALTVAISTAGASSALAARVRDRIDRDLPSDIGDLVRTLGNLRAECRQSGQPISSLRDRIDRLIDDVPGK